MRYSDTYTIEIQNLIENFKNGTWKYCRPEYYIRTNFNPESVENKKTALISVDAEGKSNVVVQEALIINDDGKDVLSGNTRIKALIELFESYSGDEYIYHPIPYKLAYDVTYEDAIDLQVSTNDFTQPHTPIELGFKMVEMKNILLERFKAEGIKPKKAQGMTSERIGKAFKRTIQSVNQLTNLVIKGNQKLFDMVIAGELSTDTALTIIQKLGDENLNQLDYTIDAIKAKCATLGTSIYRSHVIEYFKDLEDAKNTPVPDTDDSSEKPSGAEKETEKTKPNNTPELRKEFKSDLETHLQTIHTLDPKKINPNKAKNIDELNIAMLEALKTVNPLFETVSSIEIFEKLRELYLMRLGQADILLDAIDKSNGNYETYRKVIGKASSSLEKVYKDEKVKSGDSAPEAEPVSNTEPAQEQPQTIIEEITIPDSENFFETDEYLVTIS